MIKCVQENVRDVGVLVEGDTFDWVFRDGQVEEVGMKEWKGHWWARSCKSCSGRAEGGGLSCKMQCWRFTAHLGLGTAVWGIEQPWKRFWWEYHGQIGVPERLLWLPCVGWLKRGETEAWWPDSHEGQWEPKLMWCGGARKEGAWLEGNKWVRGGKWGRW